MPSKNLDWQNEYSRFCGFVCQEKLTLWQILHPDRENNLLAIDN